VIAIYIVAAIALFAVIRATVGENTGREVP